MERLDFVYFEYCQINLLKNTYNFILVIKTFQYILKLKIYLTVYRKYSNIYQSKDFIVISYLVSFYDMSVFGLIKLYGI